jgi:hypothetical protein
MLQIVKKGTEPHYAGGAVRYFLGQCTQELPRCDSA